MTQGPIIRPTKVLGSQGLLFGPTAGKITSKVTMFQPVERRGHPDRRNQQKQGLNEIPTGPCALLISF
jgi:hypothetical protein